MGSKFKIGDELIDIPRGINIPKEGEILLMKRKGTEITYIVDSVSHVVDFGASIALSKTIINLDKLDELDPEDEKTTTAI